MTVDEAMEILKKISTMYSGAHEILVYDPRIDDYVPLEDIVYVPAGEFGETQAEVRLI